METKLYNKEGKDIGSVKLPENLFGVAWNADLMHQVVVAGAANVRRGTAHTKFRSEVSGTGAKPWKQKGTGRARHGSRRSPIWRKGGVAHGPRSTTDFSVKLNRKMKAKALAVALSKKFKDGETLFVDAFNLAAPKAKDAQGAMKALSAVKGFENILKRRNNSTVVVTVARDTNIEKSFRNFGNMHVAQAKDLNPVDVLKYKYVVIAGGDDAVAVLASRVVGTKK